MDVLIYSLRLDAIKEYIVGLQEYINKNYEGSTVSIVRDREAFNENIFSRFYDIVYYDISGRETKEGIIHELQDFRLQCPETNLLLTADSEEFAILGYKVHAYDYVVYSEEKEGLIPSFMRITREKQDCSSIVYSVRMKGIWRRLELKDIIYMETNDHHVLFHMNNGQIYKKLANFNNLTPPIARSKDLLQCHKSYVINGRYVRDMLQNSFIMQNGKKISISKPNRKSARCFFNWCIMNGYVDMVEEAETKKG